MNNKSRLCKRTMKLKKIKMILEEISAIMKIL